MVNTIDITPAPRILRVLGEIPFQPWRCLAELIDNSIDSFTDAKRQGIALNEKTIIVKWSNENVPAHEREIVISDTGPGMKIEHLQNAARAGYSGNDPIHNLGLFGMGFNIATAKLGEKTRLMSATADSDKWVGLEIDFAQMIRSKSFAAPVIEEAKTDPSEHGTKIIISKLKNETFSTLRNQEASLRRQLENIYTPLLLDNVDIDIYIKSNKLNTRPLCVWGASRYITRGNQKINAIIQVDRDLGIALFDTERNAYLSEDEADDIKLSGNLPSNIVERHKRLRGWVGIQRYSDPNDFGIDFIRNGRKILISDKSLFSYENPMTGTGKIEYPVELGTTVGGRIVGEIHVDYLIPTYQKNDFDRNDISWAQTVEALRGVGPILPKMRKDLGFNDENNSPVSILANAYRRPEPGIKNLAVDKTIATEYAERFRRRERDFINDDKWWEAAQEADRKAANKGAEDSPEVDAGPIASDDPEAYLNDGSTESTESSTTDSASDTAALPTGNRSVPLGITTPEPRTSTDSRLDELLKNSKLIDVWSKPYEYGKVAPFEVKTWELVKGNITVANESVPCKFHSEGVECDFIFNPRHPLLSQFSIEPRELLAIYLSEKYKARDQISDVGNLFSKLIQIHLIDKRIDKVGLQERASALFDRIRSGLQDLLLPLASDVVACIHESNGEVEETTNALLSRPDLMKSFTRREEAGFEVLEYVPHRTLLRLIDRFPERVFDGKLFQSLYEEIELPDEKATERTRIESKDRINSFLKDALWIIGQSGNISSSRSGKDELARCSHSITFLEQELVN